MPPSKPNGPMYLYRRAALALVLASCDPSVSSSLQCTSGTAWTRGNERSPLMHPGVACIDCHTQLQGPSFYFGGTVYSSVHEPDDCSGAGGEPLVHIVDAVGATFTMNTNAAGNFYLKMRGSFVLPYRAKITYQGRTREMAAPQQSGDCNFCHTQNGSSGAPGRIFLP